MTTGLSAHFISRDDLIAAKLAAGRLQDFAEVDALRQAAIAKAKLETEKPKRESKNDHPPNPRRYPARGKVD